MTLLRGNEVVGRGAVHVLEQLVNGHAGHGVERIRSEGPGVRGQDHVVQREQRGSGERLLRIGVDDRAGDDLAAQGVRLCRRVGAALGFQTMLQQGTSIVGWTAIPVIVIPAFTFVAARVRRGA